MIASLNETAVNLTLANEMLRQFKDDLEASVAQLEETVAEFRRPPMPTKPRLSLVSTDEGD